MAALIDEYRAFIIDLDGVVYLLDEPVPGAAETIEEIQRRGLEHVYLTNNSGATPEMYVERLKGHGIRTSVSQIVTSAQAASLFIEGNYDADGSKAFVIGERGLLEECAKMGLEVVGPADWREVEFVLVGWDRHFDYEKLRAAVLAIRNGAVYIAMNRDATYPTPEGLWPGAGTMVAAVSTGAGREPVSSVGKPNPLIVDLAIDRMRADGSSCLLIGDRLDTDILAGELAGIDTLLVLTGVSRKSDIEGARARPTHVRKDLAGLME
jgi:4-nitrophenyl phosphatase